MKLSIVQNPVTTSENFTRTAFGISDFSKIFKILIDLYGDKPLAVVRELVCNAHDAKGSEPFCVSTPTALDPAFSVKDFGAGMTPEFMEDGYTQVGHSTKADSNEAVGGFGLGRLAPLAYTDTYSVVTVTGGMKRIYTIFRGEGNVPQVVLVSATASNEPTGTEVKVPVKGADFTIFRGKCSSVLRWFPQADYKAFGFEAEPAKHSLATDKWRVLVGKVETDHSRWNSRTSSYETTGHQVQLGPIAYKLDWKQVPGDIELPASIMPIFQVGELELPPSREGLSYDPQTIRALAERRDLIIQELCDLAYSMIAKMGIYERLNFVSQIKSQRLDELFKAYQISKGTWDQGSVFAKTGFGRFFRAKYEKLILTGDFRRYEKSRRTNRPQAGFKNVFELEFDTVEKIERQKFIFHDMTEDKSPRLGDRLAEIALSDCLYLIMPSAGCETLEEFRKQIPDAPDSMFGILSEIYVAPRTSKPKGPVSLNVYYHHAHDSREHLGTQLIQSGVYVEYTASQREEGVGGLLSLGWHDVVVYGLTKKARSQLDMSKFTHLRDYLSQKAEALLADRAWVRAYRANHIMNDLDPNDRHLVRAMALRPKNDPLFKDLVAACRGLIEDGVQEKSEYNYVRHLKRDPPIVDHHGLVDLLQRFHKDHSLLSFVLNISNRNETLRFDGTHDQHLKELV